jgi:hypothetical protein
MTVLSTPKFQHIIAWTPSGDSFSVLKPKEFESDILSEHLNLSKYSSFTRELRRWGFVREYKGQEAGCYSHEEFKKGRMDLVETMTGYQLTTPPSTPQGRKKKLSLLDGSDTEEEGETSNSGVSYQEMLDNFKHTDEPVDDVSKWQNSNNQLVVGDSFDDVGLNEAGLPPSSRRQSSLAGMFNSIVEMSRAPSRSSSASYGSSANRQQTRISVFGRAFGSQESPNNTRSNQAPITFASSMVDDPALLSIYSRQATAGAMVGTPTNLTRAESEQPTTRHMWQPPPRSRSGSSFNHSMANRKRTYVERNWIQLALLVLGGTLCALAGVGIYVILMRDEARAELGSSSAEGVQVQEAEARPADGGRTRVLMDLFRIIGPEAEAAERRLQT